MTKQEQFLWAVQTISLANAININSQPEYAVSFRHVVSASGMAFTSAEALWASERIPEAVSAADAATEFCSYVFENLRAKSATVPHWFARS
jgi:hypothetical protein